ncbi:beta-lactamase family protein [Kovacikia minuta CCNUW1]|uniref:serine hydrolase domain-containing protein n=1 Tax=Kovacikia minuta TaxID=2931930 RepID=UPI001CCA1F7C|nr:serine hydrolase domain-containing protein [Kovacikia minuta]UBF29225.1 beta-lactamase family protein [Kovacikia minuta CCNUW1]
MSQSLFPAQLSQGSDLALDLSHNSCRRCSPGWMCASVGVTVGLVSVLLPNAPAFAGSSVHSRSGSSMKGAIAAQNSLQAKLSPVVTQRFKELGVPGAMVGVWVKDQQWIATLGVANLAKKTPIKPNEYTRIGSITKTFTGTVVLQLEDEGKLSLKDPVSKYLPNVPNGDKITIRQLGDMRSGLFNYSEDRTFQKTLFSNPERAWNPQELIKVAFQPDNKPYFLPDQGFHYSNTNTVLLGLIAEKVTGNPLHTEVDRRIVKRFGLRHTIFPTDSTIPTPHVHGYWYDMDAKPTPEIKDVTNWNPSWGWAAGAIISKLEDVRRYSKLLATGGLVSRSTQAERLRWTTITTEAPGQWQGVPLKYGFAIASYNGAIGHNGSLPGYQSFMGYIPEQDATVVVLVNVQENAKGITPADNLARLIVDQLKRM